MQYLETEIELSLSDVMNWLIPPLNHGDTIGITLNQNHPRIASSTGISAVIGKHNREVTLLVKDYKLFCYDLMGKHIWFYYNSVAFYLGPVTPPKIDSST